MNASRIPVLMYHRVDCTTSGRASPYAVAPRRFATQMQALARAGYQAVSIDALADWLDGTVELPLGAFLLTFDDGYRGVYEHALEPLERLHWPFTVFLVSDLIGGRNDWARTDDPEGSHPLLNIDEIREMRRRGGNFHSHTCSHPDLTTLDDAALDTQLAGSRQALCGLLEKNVTYLAYPYGRCDDRVLAAARNAGYRAAFATASGFNSRADNRYRLRRIDVLGSDTPAMLLRKVRLGTNDGRLRTLMRYYLLRILGRA
jgi:peptidoglycan/xylan/chitin deacetylase (PgdA/CDA1 family)